MNTEAQLNREYMRWLHELTTEGYKRDIIIPRELTKEVHNLFKNKVKPAAAIDTIIGIATYKQLNIIKKK